MEPRTRYERLVAISLACLAVGCFFVAAWKAGEVKKLQKRNAEMEQELIDFKKHLDFLLDRDHD